MIKLYYYKYDKNSKTASELYSELYPERRQPAKTLLKLLAKNLIDYDSLKKTRKKYGNRSN